MKRLVIAALVLWCIQGLAWGGPSAASKTTKQGYSKASTKKAKEKRQGASPGQQGISPTTSNSGRKRSPSCLASLLCPMLTTTAESG